MINLVRAYIASQRTLIDRDHDGFPDARFDEVPGRGSA